MLRRPTCRGVVLSASAVSAAVARQAEAAVPAALVQSTIKAGLAVAAGQTLAAGVVAASVAALVKGGNGTMFINALKLAVTVLVAGVLTAGAGVVALQGEAGPGAVSAPPAPVPAGSPSTAVSREAARSDDAQLLDAAQRMFDSQWLAYTRGRIAVDRIADASRRWLDAELSASSGPAGRTAAYQAHQKRMEKLEAYEYSALPKHQGSDENFTAARFLRLEAAKLVADARGAGPAAPAVAEAPRPRPAVPIPPEALPRPKIAALPLPVASDLPPPVALDTSGDAAADDILDDDHYHISIAKLGPRVAARDNTPGTRVIVDRLEKPIAMSFARETPLQDVLKYLQEATRGPGDSGIPFFVEQIGLNAAERTLASPVTIDLEGVSLKTTLRLLLSQLGLSYCVKEGTVIISTPEQVYWELKEAQVLARAAVVARPAAARGW